MTAAARFGFNDYPQALADPPPGGCLGPTNGAHDGGVTFALPLPWHARSSAFVADAAHAARSMADAQAPLTNDPTAAKTPTSAP
ncbi:hypothetical protein, partial [Ideonella azotifigens]|uniref:hypothetical protein n=1 Tax=Ideonella azotifigens TaxID=513160 RepID=UPI001B8794B4